MGRMHALNVGTGMFCCLVCLLQLLLPTSLSKEVSFYLKKPHSEKLILKRTEYLKHPLYLAELNAVDLWKTM